MIIWGVKSGLFDKTSFIFENQIWWYFGIVKIPPLPTQAFKKQFNI